MASYLRDFGCKVLLAEGAVKGIEMAREQRPDLITLDLMMPGMDGWEALRVLKDDPELREIPVVVVSIVAKEGGRGVTITIGRFLGIARKDAARFSFLLSVPVILLATIFEAVILITGDAPIAWDNLALAALISAIVAYISIEFFMRIVSAIGLLPFAIYRVLLAGVIVYVLV